MADGLAVAVGFPAGCSQFGVTAVMAPVVAVEPAVARAHRDVGGLDLLQHLLLPGLVQLGEGDLAAQRGHRVRREPVEVHVAVAALLRGGLQGLPHDVVRDALPGSGRGLLGVPPEDEDATAPGPA